MPGPRHPASQRAGFPRALAVASLACMGIIILRMGAIGCGDSGEQGRVESSRDRAARQTQRVDRERRLTADSVRESSSPELARVSEKSETGLVSGAPAVPSDSAISGPPTVMTGVGDPTAGSRRAMTYPEAEGLYQQGSYSEAFEAFRAYAASKPENAWGHYMLGLSAWKAGLPTDAEMALRAALRLDPDHLKVRVNLARVLLDLDRPREALAVVKRAVELHPQSGDAHRVLGRAYHNMGRSEEAIAAYQHAIARDSSDIWAMNNLGLVRMEEARYEDALPPLARATQLRGSVAAFQNNLGMALERTGHLNEAAAAYRAALQADSNYAQAATSLARVEALPVDTNATPIDLVALAGRFGADTLTAPLTVQLPESVRVAPPRPAEPEDPPVVSAER